MKISKLPIILLLSFFAIAGSSTFAQKKAADPMFSKKKVNKKNGAYEDKKDLRKSGQLVIAEEF